MSALLFIFTPGRECVGTGLVPQVSLIAMPSRDASGIGALSPRRVRDGNDRGQSMIGGRLNRLSIALCGAKLIDSLSKGGAGQVVREAAGHGATMRTAHAGCHGTARGSFVP